MLYFSWYYQNYALFFSAIINVAAVENYCLSNKIHIIGNCQTFSADMLADQYLSRSNNNPLVIRISAHCQTLVPIRLAELYFVVSIAPPHDVLLHFVVSIAHNFYSSSIIQSFTSSFIIMLTSHSTRSTSPIGRRDILPIAANASALHSESSAVSTKPSLPSVNSPSRSESTAAASNLSPSTENNHTITSVVTPQASTLKRPNEGAAGSYDVKRLNMADGGPVLKFSSSSSPVKNQFEPTWLPMKYVGLGSSCVFYGTQYGLVDTDWSSSDCLDRALGQYQAFNGLTFEGLGPLNQHQTVDLIIKNRSIDELTAILQARAGVHTKIAKSKKAMAKALSKLISDRIDSQ